MRWSQSFLPTLREDPTGAEAASHKLLVRAGFVRAVGAGLWAYLPPAQRAMGRIAAILREEMARIGAQEFHLPALLPADLWRESGRWQQIGADLFRLKDHKGSDDCLGMTHEEVFTSIARDGLSSYRQLPQIWYQIQAKFRDEPRPKSGVIRDRQFTMKDSYSFDIDEMGLDRSYDLHRQAYERIFSRTGLAFTMVEASSGAMGGSSSAEFIVESPAGEDTILSCACGYAANREKGRSALATVQDSPGGPGPVRFPTPGVRTIEDLARFPGGAAADRQVKTLVYIVEGKPLLVLLLGDHTLEEEKLKAALGTGTFRPATAEECVDALGAHPGSLGAVGVRSVPVHADEALRNRRGMTTGANADDFHLRDVDVGRDIPVTAWADLRQAEGGEPCVRCGKPLKAFKGIEVGHIFKLGTRYSASMKAFVTDERGRQIPIVMGSYGIGLERILACAVELWHDEKGISWPASIAPFQVLVTSLQAKDEGVMSTSRAIHEALLARGIDSLWDDREANAGVKLNDADLIGIPLRVTIGPKKIKEGKVEVSVRRTGEMRVVPASDTAAAVAELLPTLP